MAGGPPRNRLWSEVGVEFGLLGPVTAWHGGDEVAITGGRQRCVLALLLLEAGRVVSVERLVDTLWEDDSAPRTARNVVQQCVSDLRRLLAVDGRVHLVHKPPGYALEVAPEQVDLNRFRSLVTAARCDAGGGRAVLLRRALDLWRGEPLADVDASALAPVRHALAEERLAVLEECLEWEVASGRHAQAVPELSALVTEHPLRERLTELLMSALYRDGRRADALRRYQCTRRLLARELGTEPGPALQDLHQRILTTDPTLTCRNVVTTGEGGRAVAPRQLPAAPTPFVGRHDELNRLDTALRHAPGSDGAVVVFAIAGPGGIGKTALALHWAHRNADRFPDGQLFVDLRGFGADGQPMDPVVALRGFLDALGVPPDRVPHDPHAQAALFRSLVAGKRVLVVLDNAVDNTQVSPVLPGSGSCAVVVTSRNRLYGLITGHGAQHVPLDVLSAAEARTLLADRLGHARVTAEPAAVEDLIALCGRFPLALSIVASQAHTRPDLPLTALAGELRDLGLGVLDDDPAASLPAVLSWSHRALTPEQATAFALLGIAPGPDIGPHAAAALVGLPLERTARVLRGLENASLLNRDTRGRYTMHDLIRGYAATAHRPPDDTREAALRRVLDFYLRTAHAADRLLHPHRPSIALDPPPPHSHAQPPADAAAAMTWFETEHPNLLAAQHTASTHAWHQTAWQLAWVLNTFHYRQGHRHDRLAVWQAASRAAAHLPDPTTHTLVHRLLGSAHADVGNYEQATDHLRQALSLAEHHHDVAQQAHAHNVLARISGQRGNHLWAREHAARALALYRVLGQPVDEAIALNAVGWYTARAGDHDTARVHCQSALALHQRHYNRSGEAATWDSLGWIDHHSGHHARAISHYRQALALYRALGYTYQSADTLDELGHTHADLGQHDEARRVWREALELYERLGRAEDADRVRRQLARA